MRQLERADIVASGSLPSYDFVSTRHRGEVVHVMTATGPLDLARRIDVYRATLSANPTSSYFCILDNSAGFENDFSISDIRFLDRMLLEAGIRIVHGVTVTRDAGYPKLLELLRHVMPTEGLVADVHLATSLAEAEHLLAEMVDRAGRRSL